jgi:hypothetical protein
MCRPERGERIYHVLARPHNISAQVFHNCAASAEAQRIRSMKNGF